MSTPTIALPPRAAHEPPEPLPELPPQLLLTLLTNKAAPDHDRDALDAFVLSGGAGSGGDSTGGVQVEDILNELLPDGALPSRSPRPAPSTKVGS